MKKMLIVATFMLLLLTQCRKEEEVYDNEKYHTEEPEMVPVRFKIPVDKMRSDFGDLFPLGKIGWGNEKKEEYIYLAAPEAYEYYHIRTGLHYVGMLFELRADISEGDDTLFFEGKVYNLLHAYGKPETEFYIYYFGNNGAAPEGSNVTDINRVVSYTHLIGKTVTFDNQTGSVDNVGDFHVAKARVTLDPIDGILGVKLKGYNVTMEEPLKSITSLALLDLEGESKLEGSATRLKSLTVMCMEDSVFTEQFEYDTLGYIDVSDNAGDRSLITLLPTEEKVTLECSKGKYEFTNGIKSNYVYFEENGATLEEAQPLIWETP